MNHLHRIGCTALIAAATALPTFAQTNGSNSPYSRYGVGLLADGGNAFNKAMAGTAYGMADSKQLNTLNPASYAAIDSLTFLFDFGLSLQNANVSAGGTKTNVKNTSVDYITAGFRIAPKLGMSLGLIPFSTVGYNTTSEKKISSGHDDITQTTTFSGDGGLHEAYLGLGWNAFSTPKHALSVGANAGYLWGNLNHIVYMTFDDTNINSSRQVYDANLRTYKLDFGLQYAYSLGAKDRLTLGVVYGLGHDINRPACYYNQKTSSSSILASDTLTAANAFSLPHTLGAGVTWSHGHSLRIGADYTLQKWGSAHSPSVVNVAGEPFYTAVKGNYTDRHRVSLGMEYVRNPESLKWNHRIRYRLGLAYSTPYTKVDGQDGPRSYQASLGVALPITNRYNNRSLLNFTVQYERVEPKLKTMVTENYLRFCIGLSFNERWFMKWKAE